MTTTITGALGIDNIKAATGAVLQVVSVNKSDTWTYSGSTTFQDITGLAATITPTSSSSKILVQVNINISGTERYHGARLLRGSTLYILFSNIILALKYSSLSSFEFKGLISLPVLIL